ncbi:hypothetical protein N9O16_03005 [Candidatus Poseidoniaceae archaeon]|nr:hypothetical protein [Candidatus Poseidoniaceae archaeon]
MGLRKGKKKNAQNPPAPVMPLPPLPGMPLPPGALPLPDAPTPLPLPEAPAPAPLPAAPMPLPEAPSPAPVASNEYGEMWAKRSDKPLQQIYGHIDRLSKKDTGSLLDRYADRFGHSLDREIVVLRKKDREAKLSEIRDAPVVQLLEEDDGDLQTQLSAIEDEIRTLRPEYQAAKASGDSAVLSQLRPILESLMNERKSIKAMLHDGDSSTTEVQEAAVAEDSGEDVFIEFVSIVDDLLGSALPEDIVSDFIASADFSIYQQVGENPSAADDGLRSQFVSIVDAQLGNMDEDSINSFVASPGFQVYSSVATLYQPGSGDGQ